MEPAGFAWDNETNRGSEIKSCNESAWLIQEIVMQLDVSIELTWAGIKNFPNVFVCVGCAIMELMNKPKKNPPLVRRVYMS